MYPQSSKAKNNHWHHPEASRLTRTSLLKKHIHPIKSNLQAFVKALISFYSQSGPLSSSFSNKLYPTAIIMCHCQLASRKPGLNLLRSSRMKVNFVFN